jgi:hypothetical protein
MNPVGNRAHAVDATPDAVDSIVTPVPVDPVSVDNP